MSEEAEIEIEIEGEQEEQPPAKKPEGEKAGEEAGGKVDIEVVDDTPPEDRNRKPAPPPKDPTEEELEAYSENVRNRINHFTRGYHDQRRAAEAAGRERDEAVNYARKLQEQINALRGSDRKNREMMLNQAKTTAKEAHDFAKKELRIANESGDIDAITEAQAKLADATYRLNRANNFKLPPSQDDEDGVKRGQDEPKGRQSEPELQPKSPVRVDEKAQAWYDSNAWFGKDPEMTATALGYHQTLVAEGVDTNSDGYYDKLNSRMRKLYPERFDDGLSEDDLKPPAKKPAAVVAPATRSVSPRKIKLTATQVSLAKRLGVPLEEYAKQVALEESKP